MFICQIEAVQTAVPVVNQRLSVFGPIGSLQRVSNAVDNLPRTSLKVHHFEIATNVVAIRLEVVRRGNGNADVVEYCLFRYVLIMRTNKQPNINIVTKI